MILTPSICYNFILKTIKNRTCVCFIITIKIIIIINYYYCDYYQNDSQQQIDNESKKDLTSEEEKPSLQMDQKETKPLLSKEKEMEKPLLSKEKEMEKPLLSQEKEMEKPLLSKEKEMEKPLLSDKKEEQPLGTREESLMNEGELNKPTDEPNDEVGSPRLSDDDDIAEHDKECDADIKSDNRHEDDVEMISQSSGGTEPADEDEDKHGDEVKTTNTTEKENSGSSNDWSDDKGSDGYKGSGEDEKWSRPWLRSDNWNRSRKITLPRLSGYSSFDTKEYRNGYPRKKDDLSVNHNFEFYTNKRSSYPQGDFVDAIHKNWWGNYDLLEYHHSYIQWLFPIRERGLNWHAEELQLHEIEKITGDKKAHERVLTSYKMMLDFYGLELEDEKTGQVKRSQKWRGRFSNLNHSGHNYLRITRILKCLGEFNYEHLKAPLIRHFLHEAIVERTLINALNSCVSYWIEVIKNDKEREELHKHAKTLVDKTNNEAK